MTTSASALEQGKSPFSKYERWFLAGAVALIACWGVVGVDLDSRFEPSEQRPSISRSYIAPVKPGGSGEMSASATRGAEVFEANGCYACHSVDGSKKIGPTLLGVWGRPQLLGDGSSVVVDRDYVHESILNPQAKLVKGYDDVAMPSYQDLVTEDDLSALSDYLETLR